jgi:ABC-2 type transport system ATP-binding protein
MHKKQTDRSVMITAFPVKGRRALQVGHGGAGRGPKSAVKKEVATSQASLAPRPGKSPILRVEGVTKRYGDRTALESVDLEVAPGEIVGLLGPNGAGKTTLVEVVTGLRRPDAGTVFVSGSDVVRNPRVARRLIGFAPQDLGIYPRATVAENLKFFAGLAGLSRRQAALRAEEVSRAMGLASLSERRAHTLSGGQKHRLHAAAAIAHRPPLLLLDEPTVGSDIETRQMLLDIVRGLAAEGTAVVYTTHYLPELEVLGATIAILEGGRIVARGTQDSLIRRYGGAALKLVFDGPAPELPDMPRASRSGSLLRVEADDPAGAAVSILARLGPHARRLQSIDIVRPGLEAVYLELTGRRSPEAAAQEEDRDAA